MNRAPPPLATSHCDHVRTPPSSLSFASRLTHRLLAEALRTDGLPLQHGSMHVRTVDDLHALRFVQKYILAGTWHSVFCVASRLFLLSPRPPGKPGERYVAPRENIRVRCDDADRVRAFAAAHGYTIGDVVDAVFTDYARHVFPLMQARVADPLQYVTPYRREYADG